MNYTTIRIAIASMALSVVACGGGTEMASKTAEDESQAAAQTRPERYTQTSVVELERGELALGADDAQSNTVALSLRGKPQEIVIRGCFTLRARTDKGRFEIGRVESYKEGGKVMLRGLASRERVAQLLEGSNPKLVTCHQVINLREEGIDELRDFLAGRANAPEETWDTRTVSVPGIDMRWRISSLRPDEVRLDVEVGEDRIPASGCGPLVGIAGGRSFELGAPKPGTPGEGSASGGSAPSNTAGATRSFQLTVPRPTAQWLFVGDSAEIAGCGRRWQLDSIVLRNLRSLIGTPDEDASPPASVDPPEPIVDQEEGGER